MPAANWVAQAYAFAQSRPEVGAYASQIHGEFESELPPNFKRIAPFLAITERGPNPLKYEPAKRLLPPSAGLVVRKQAWVDSVPQETVLGGRNGVSGSMLAGEDIEVLIYIQRQGWEIWYNPAMETTHKIPARRLERQYLLPCFRGMGLSRWATRRLLVEAWKRPLILLVYLLSDLRKLVRLVLKHRQDFKSDVVVACEIELLIGSLMSPFYLYFYGYLRKQPAKPSVSNSEAISAYSQAL